MEAIGFWPPENEQCGHRRSGFGTPNVEHFSVHRCAVVRCLTHRWRCSQSMGKTWCSAAGFASTQARSRFVFLSIFDHCTVMLAVAVLLAGLGSGVSARVAAFSVITVPAGAVTFTVRRTVQVVFTAMLLFS
jgi:hypothetical protein